MQLKLCRSGSKFHVEIAPLVSWLLLHEFQPQGNLNNQYRFLSSVSFRDVHNFFTRLLEDHTLTEHNSSQLKMDGGKMNQLLLRQNAHFSVTITVCFRQGIENHNLFIILVDVWDLMKSSISLLLINFRNPSTTKNTKKKQTKTPPQIEYIPSRELTYPTWGKGKSSSKCHFWGIC